MSRVVKGAAILAAACLGVILAGCGEREQVVVYKQGKYQGKPDTKPWNNAPTASLYTPEKWTPGDEQSWENSLKARNMTQNEYNRAE